MPWKGVCMVAEVTHKITTGARPEEQISKCDVQLADLIRDCWSQRPSKRPDFTTIVTHSRCRRGSFPLGALTASAQSAPSWSLACWRW